MAFGGLTPWSFFIYAFRSLAPSPSPSPQPALPSPHTHTHTHTALPSPTQPYPSPPSHSPCSLPVHESTHARLRPRERVAEWVLLTPVWLHPSSTLLQPCNGRKNQTLKPPPRACSVLHDDGAVQRLDRAHHLRGSTSRSGLTPV